MAPEAQSNRLRELVLFSLAIQAEQPQLPLPVSLKIGEIVFLNLTFFPEQHLHECVRNVGGDTVTKDTTEVKGEVVQTLAQLLVRLVLQTPHEV